MFNFSNYTLSNEEWQVVKLGLKYVPDPQWSEKDFTQLKTDLKQFQVKLRREEHFRRHVTNDNNTLNNEPTQTRKDMFANPSRWVPDPSDDRIFQSILENIGQQANTQPERHKQFKSNVTREQRKAIGSLARNNEIVLKEADKGGATVILNKQDYHAKMYEILQDSTTYKQITNYSINTTKRKIEAFIKKHEDALTKKERLYLKNFEMKTGYIYGLPKIHKCPKLKEKTQECILDNKDTLEENFTEFKIPFRPIVSGRHCPVSRLSELLKKILRPFEQRLPHLMRDSYDFLGTLEDSVPKDTTMVAIDIVALYPSITNQLGRDATEYWLDMHPELLGDFSKTFVMNLLDLVQSNVFMTFNHDTYQQVEGTAMGKAHAPPYANLVVSFLISTKLLPMIASNHNEGAASHINKHIKLFLDDGFLFLDEKQITATDLLEHLNRMDPAIRFTMDVSSTEIPFLDVLIKLRHDPNNPTRTTIITDIYSKPTDSFNYFDFQSCAPRHVKRNIPYTLARRIATIVSDDKLKTQRLAELRPKLQRRGYPERLIGDAINKAESLERKILLQTKEKEPTPKDRIIFTSTYNPRIVDPAIRLKQACMNLKHTTANMPTTLIAARRQPPNLRRILSLSKKRDQYIEQNEAGGQPFTRCEDKRCKTCPASIQEGNFTTQNGTVLTRKHAMSCKSKDLIYMIICNGCGGEYIGETGRTLSERMNLHRSHISCIENGKLQVSKHIRTCASNLETKFKIFPFFKCNKGSHYHREVVEQEFRELVRPGLH